MFFKHCLSVIFLLLTAVSFAQTPLFTMKGSNTVGASLAPELARAFMKKIGASNITVINDKDKKRVMGLKGRQVLVIDIYAHGSSTGFVGLHANNTDIALASRRIKAAEKTKLLALGDMTHFSLEKIIALDGLAVIVHPNNPINALSIDRIADIFTGKITSWKEINGRTSPINIYARDNQSGTWDTFKSLVLKKNATLTETAQRFDSNTTLSEQVSQNINAIGFVSLNTINNSKALAVSNTSSTALKPSAHSVATEDYLLSRRLYMYLHPKRKNAFVNDFMAFTQSNEGQQIVGSMGFVSQNPSATKVEQIENAPPFYQVLANEGKRLSVNFRFSNGSATLDNKAQQDIQRLVDYLKTVDLNTHAIQLVGFGDEKQTPARSQVLSKLRAAAVKSALYKHDIMSKPIAGLGSNMPVFEQSGNNRYKNQRVEVWLVKNH